MKFTRRDATGMINDLEESRKSFEANMMKAMIRSDEFSYLVNKEEVLKCNAKVVLLRTILNSYEIDEA